MLFFFSDRINTTKGNHTRTCLKERWFLPKKIRVKVSPLSPELKGIITPYGTTPLPKFITRDPTTYFTTSTNVTVCPCLFSRSCGRRKTTRRLKEAIPRTPLCYCSLLLFFSRFSRQYTYRSFQKSFILILYKYITTLSGYDQFY